MMRALDGSLAVYLYRQPVDMRKGRNGLGALASEMMPESVYSGAVFVFVGRRFDTVKCLRWDRNGFAVWHKVIESDEKYHWPADAGTGGDHAHRRAAAVVAGRLRCVASAAPDAATFLLKVSCFT